MNRSRDLGRLFCFITCLLLFFSVSLYANNKLPISYIGIHQGLSNNSVRCIYQDRSGFIWFGTYYGLNRYDGNEFKVFTNKLGDSTSLPHNYIYSLHEDKFRNLWVSTGLALSIYNRVLENFSYVYYEVPESKKAEKIHSGVNDMSSDNEGNVFLASDEFGLLVKRAGDKMARPVPFPGRASGSAYQVSNVAVIGNKVWLLIRGEGIALYHLSTNTIEMVNHEVKDFSCLATDRKGNIWLGSETGLYKYEVASNAITEKYQDGPGGLSGQIITSICFDKDGRLWIGTDGAGVSILNTTTRTFDYLQPGEEKGNLSSETVNSIIADNESRIWIGTLRGGCDIVDVYKSRFQTISRTPFSNNSLPSNVVYSFCEDKDHDLLVGTDGGGLSVWDRKSNTFLNYQHKSGVPASLSNNAVASIRQDSYGDIWVGTFGGGINKFNKAAGTFERYPCYNDQAKTENLITWLLYEDHRKDLWVATYRDGKLYRFDRSLNRFVIFSQDLTNLVSLFEDSKGNFWGGNASFLIRIDRSGQHKDQYTEIGKPVRAIFEDKQHRLWLGIEGLGLMLFDSKAGKIIARYSEADGLCNNSILNILDDSEGNLWLSTFNGISKFDPARKVFKNYYQSDGLQSNQFSYRAALKLQSGELAFGGIYGFNLFDPAKIQARRNMPPVALTGIWINNKPVSEVTELVITDTVYNSIKKLRVPFNQAVLSFRFAALEYSSPEKIKYSYYLQGWDRQWNYSDNVRTINYNNIGEGKYTLRIRATNAEGTWNKEEVALELVVLPPWYRTWWAYTIYILLAIGAIWLYLRYKRNQTKLEYEVKVAHLEAEKEKELNEKKLTFFTNISHEFRTPLTLIINPVKDLLYGDHQQGKPVDTSDLNIVYRNARRLLSLVDQLLLFRKADSESDKLRVSRSNFSDLCYEVFLCFTRQASTKQLQYEFVPDGNDTVLHLDTEKIEIALFNLLSNAIKYTPAGGKVQMLVQATANGCEVLVKDNGPGISESRRQALFEKFYQAKEIQGQTGFGIGLYVARTFVNQHKGTIDYTANPGGGSCFRISLLGGRDHFGPQAIFEDSSRRSPILEELVVETETRQEAADEKQPAQVVSAMSDLVTDEKLMLVVDDHEQIRQYVTQIFRGKFKIYEAASAEEGLPMARQFSPDIIISDVVMKEMTGIELCNAVKSDPNLSHIPVILLTASSAADIKLKGLEYGADDYITKPFERDILVARVNNLLRNRDMLQKYFYNEVTLKENHIKISAEYKEFLERCMQIVEENIERDDFNIKMLAGAIGMSHSNLYKKIKSISGQTANAFIRFIRLRRAAELMINTDSNVSEIAFQVGISDPRYFRQQFNQLFGMNPSDYISKYRKPFQRKYNLNENAARNSE